MTDQARKPNRLIQATSPYLRQHAYNPVDWFQWGEEAHSKAIREDKPILVSIGYSSCHWCHVMEHESFENEDVAQIMNEHFVCIKVDREERPDIDQVYMEAVQAMQQHGGWPLNVFLTPQQKPFFGGTYFPPGNWAQLLIQLSKAFRQRRAEIDQTAEELRKHLQQSDLQRFARDPAPDQLDGSVLDKMCWILYARFDKKWGGIDKAPKFVMPSIWQFLLNHFNVKGRPESLEMVNLTLSRIARGGLYDQVGGGFSRYSVDVRWFAPHFEKMLYDNAQLVSLFSRAFAETGDKLYRQTVYETIAWLQREMTGAGGGLYSALDADSEGVEGRYYTWTWDELISVLGEDGAALTHYHATRAGNWEHGRNILTRLGDGESAPRPDQKDVDAITKIKLLEVRSKRVRPGLDDKIITGWNALMIQGWVDAYKSFSDPEFLHLANQTMTFLERNLVSEGKIYRAFKDHRSATEGFLEDYAFVIQACTSLYQVTFREEWLRKAAAWCTYVMDHFYDPAEGYFHFSSTVAEQLIARKKEIFDNVIPASNSVMARNLYHLGTILDRHDWKAIAINMTAKLASLIEEEPGSMANWGILLSEIATGLREVVISGPEAEGKRKELHRHHLPFVVTLGTEDRSDLPLLQGRDAQPGKTLIYVCFNKTCQLPVESVSEALAQLAMTPDTTQ